MTHFAIRGLMHEAALQDREDPDRLSFLHAVRVVRRKLPHGDDLLLIGPWNVILDLTAEIHIRFRSEFGGREHDGLTISAGVAFARHGLPVRYAVDRAEELLELAKSGNKNKCATLGGVFEWKQIDKIRKIGRRIQQWIDGRICSRGLIRSLYELADSERLDKAGLWVYQVGRNFPPKDASGQEAQELRKWGEALWTLFKEHECQNWPHPLVRADCYTGTTRSRG